MKDWLEIKARYDKDSLAIKIGGLASNLARIHWMFERNQPAAKIEPMIKESKYFTEWAAETTDIEVQMLLAEIQLDLALWERRLVRGDSLAVIEQAPKVWSQRLLKSVGLLD